MKLLSMFYCQDGDLSCIRVTSFLTCVTVLSVWVVCCFLEGRFIPITWEMTVLIGGAQAAKAAQARWEKV